MIAITNAALIDDAVQWAYGQGLTTYPTTSSFSQYNALRRDEAAKFFVNFAKSVGKTANTVDASACNSFTDLHQAYANLRPFVLQSCRMGIFKGGSNGKFNPDGYITNAQTIVALMRIIDGNQAEN